MFRPGELSCCRYPHPEYDRGKLPFTIRVNNSAI